MDAVFDGKIKYDKFCETSPIIRRANKPKYRRILKYFVPGEFRLHKQLQKNNQFPFRLVSTPEDGQCLTVNFTDISRAMIHMFLQVCFTGIVIWRAVVLIKDPINKLGPNVVIKATFVFLVCTSINILAVYRFLRYYTLQLNPKEGTYRLVTIIFCRIGSKHMTQIDSGCVSELAIRLRFVHAYRYHLEMISLKGNETRFLFTIASKCRCRLYTSVLANYISKITKISYLDVGIKDVMSLELIHPAKYSKQL
ncbi:hypothetical protein GJ496_007364 [Pomphorhynchus laevis]|nr:hypothetical protein GJ496_007364 [Pomphorhynchus laevis]